MTKAERLAKMQEKHSMMMAFDDEYRQDETIIVAGVDEAGRGPLAGPVVAACAILPEDFDVIGVDDSKKLSEKRREELFKEILNKSLATGVGIADNNLIDEINILQATKKAMQEALENANKMLEEKTGKTVNHVLFDAVEIKDLGISQSSIIKGDAKSLSIAAASIIAKVTRDRMMMEYHQEYPYYGFDSNKGYGTKAHYEGISEHGITPIHRKTFLKNLDL
ncbi:MAG: ribonuclease HII [Firmicutes bacterium]|nr:ribonuclease HII [Bacillota bacterium]